MTDKVSQFEEILALALTLSPHEKIRLIGMLEVALESEMSDARSLYGILADLGPAPSAEDIDEARREMWSNFPREDIA